MAKKIQLHKQTLRVLSAEEMEAVAGGGDMEDEGPQVKSTFPCISFTCFAPVAATNPDPTSDS